MLLDKNKKGIRRKSSSFLSTKPKGETVGEDGCRNGLATLLNKIFATKYFLS